MPTVRGNLAWPPSPTTIPAAVTAICPERSAWALCTSMLASSIIPRASIPFSTTAPRCGTSPTSIASSLVRALRSLSASLSLDNLTFLGRLPPAEMGALMPIGDLHLVKLDKDPSTSMTSLNKPLATLVSGRSEPAVATGETPRVLDDTVAGWRVTPGDGEGPIDPVRQINAVGKVGTDHLGAAALLTEREVDTNETFRAHLALSRSPLAVLQ